MIAFVHGSLEMIEENSCVIDVGGIGYRVFTPDIQALSEIGIGRDIMLFTYLQVREDAFTLFGFLEKESLEVFKKLITVNGVGPKFALAVLSFMSLEAFASAVYSENAKAIAKVPGIGPKTAARIILDLKDKIDLNAADITPVREVASAAKPSEKLEIREAREVLCALGYSAKDAEKYINAALEGIRPETLESATTEEIVALAMRFI